MDLEKVRDNLIDAASKIAEIGDARDFSKKNLNEFMRLFKNVEDNYIYIILNSALGDAILEEAYEIVDDIRYANPSLSEYIDKILNPHVEEN